MKSGEIRQSFLDFFASKSHTIVKSAPMVIKDDPTLMFTNAGMNQFKDVILGNIEPKSKRVANSQKCLRVSGKHNDLEEVGHDTYHHTMFEMLGNWSFGDYFKKEAIEYAWEFLTVNMGLPKNRFYATVFEGSKDDGLGPDQEAYDYWLRFLPKENILYGSKKDNFWEMGDTGPCGPCSELHIDLRDEEEILKCSGRELVNKDNPLVIEIWNLVFMQYNRKADSSLEGLPNTHVDTGMGFERLCMAVQGKKSNYDTDVFTPIISEISELTGMPYGKDDNIDIAMRVIADHLRTISFSITDGQMPSNNKAGYVIRRILRRAVRYSYTYLEQKEAFIYKLIPILIKVMGGHYPELVTQKTMIEKVIKEEENSFLHTLERGIGLIERVIAETKSNNHKEVSGSTAFTLYDTYGYPLDLTQLILKEEGLSVNLSEFNQEMEKQKNRSRAATSVAAGDWVEVRGIEEEIFVGYDNTTADVKIMRYRKVSQKNKEFYHIVFDVTPFYGEGGGQVGDTGYIESETDKIYIIDTKKENGLIVHITDKLPSNIYEDFTAVVNSKKRIMIAANHTATHLLDYALREVLGKHVEQKGSYVGTDYLRFDFSHFQKVSQEDLDNVEKRINALIRENIQQDEYRCISMLEAKNMNAIAIFGEKYGDDVRVIKFGDSIELCGGTHAKSTGELGIFKIISEGSVSAGVRRIEAVSGEKAEEYINDKINILNEIKAFVKSNKNIIDDIHSLVSKNEEMKQELEEFKKTFLGGVKDSLKKSFKEEVGINIVTRQVEIDADDTKEVLFKLRGELYKSVAILGGLNKEKPFISIMITNDLVDEYGLNAGKIIKEVAKEIGGGGGGQAFFASAGGSKPDGIKQAIDKAKDLILSDISN